MTERLYNSPDVFIAYHESAFHLSLASSDKSNIRVLHAVDRARLKQISLRLDSGWVALDNAAAKAKGKSKGKGKDDGAEERERQRLKQRFLNELREWAHQASDVGDQGDLSQDAVEDDLADQEALSQEMKEIQLQSPDIDGSLSPARSMSISPTRPPQAQPNFQTPRAAPTLAGRESPTKTVRPFARTNSVPMTSASPLLANSSRAFARNDSASSLTSASSNCRPGGYLAPGSPTKRARSDPSPGFSSSSAPAPAQLEPGQAYDVTKGLNDKLLDVKGASVPWTLLFWLASLVGRPAPKTREPFAWSSLSFADWKELREGDGLAGAALVERRLGFKAPFDVRQALREADLEEAALKKKPTAGLGLEEGWYGGKVHFKAKVKKLAAGGFHIVVGPPRLGSSCNLIRRFGSSAFVRLQIDDECKRGNQSGPSSSPLHSFLARPFVILGQPFVPVCARESLVFLLRLDAKCPIRRSLFDFDDWYGKWTLNSKQTLLKYMQRTVLGFSTSVPVVRFKRGMLKVAEDIYGKDRHGKEIPSACLTDGAAAISHAAMMKLTRTVDMAMVPSAIQGRIGGAKGVWYLGSEPFTSSDSVEKIYLRDSQIKIKRRFDEEWDAAMMTLDLVQPARCTFPSSLSQQILFVLSHCGVPNDVLVTLAREQIREDFEELTPKGKGDGLRLAKVIDERCGITSTWARDAAAQEARAKGLASRRATDQADMDDGDGIEGEDGDGADSAGPAKTDSVGAVAYTALTSGFDPTESLFTLDKLSVVARLEAEKRAKRFQITLSRSVELMVIPDPLGILKPGQISVHFARPDKIVDPDTRMSISHLAGEVLVLRHPCLLPTDIQKVEAVFKPELAYLRDVVVFPAKGERSLADLLSGGDYDGDTVRIIFEPSIVKPFKNADLRFSLPPKEIESHFEKETLTVDQFLKSVKPAERDEYLLNRVVRPVTAFPQAGIYGILHRNSAYLNGVDHPLSVQLAHKFAAVLDGTKTGVSVRAEVLRRDRQAFDCKMPSWAEKGEYDDLVGTNKMERKSDPRLPPSIHDQLAAVGKSEADELNARWKERIASTNFQPDEDLLRPWREAVEKGRLTSGQIEAIRALVDSALALYHGAIQSHTQDTRVAEARQPGGSKTRQAELRKRLKSQLDEASAMVRRWRRSAAICGVGGSVVGSVTSLASSSTMSLTSTTSSLGVSPTTSLSASPFLSPSVPASSAASTLPVASLDRLEEKRLGLLIASYAYTADIERPSHGRLREISNGSASSSLSPSTSTSTSAGGSGSSGMQRTQSFPSSRSSLEAKFAFDVSLRELCEIKSCAVASRTGHAAVVLPPSVWRAVRVSKGAIAAREEGEGEGEGEEIIKQRDEGEDEFDMDDEDALWEHFRDAQ